MSLRTLHLLFITLSALLSLFFGTWALGEYRVAGSASYALAAALSFGAAVGLAWYGIVFRRKTLALTGMRRR